MVKLKRPRTTKATLVGLSAACYLLGIILPAFQIRKMYIFKNDVTILGSVWMLFGRNEFFLASIILFFSIMLPLLKYSLLFWGAFGRKSSLANRFHSFAGVLSRHAMLDVYVIALFILSFKMGRGIITVQLRSGTVFFVVSVLTSLWASALSDRKGSKTNIPNKGVS